MSERVPARLRLRLPATSANLGPGFDSLALALALYLEVEAQPAEARFAAGTAKSGACSIEASGRSVAVCAALERNLLLDTYREVWTRYAQGEPLPLALTIRNGIPLGMGCGSSAASRLAGIALASHYAALGWTRQRMLEEATALEHHPDNAAACCLGGFVASGYATPSGEFPSEVSAAGKKMTALHPELDLRAVQALSIEPPASWHALLVLPELPFATTESRAVLPVEYSRDAMVYNLQNVAVLVAAFAQGNAAMLRAATGDLMHQPYRGVVCPLLPRLLPLAGSHGILSVTLSGAGSGVLCLLESEAAVATASAHILAAAADATLGNLPVAELLACKLAKEPATLFYD